MWDCCTGRGKNGMEFTFKNGTRVKASDPDQALSILKSIKFHEVSKVFQIASEMWVINFGENLSMQVEAQEPVSARRAGEWLLYLDRRDPQLIR
jgi:hypothetical protein